MEGIETSLEKPSKHIETNEKENQENTGSSSRFSISALHLAILDGNYTQVDSILKQTKQKVDIDSVEDMGWSPLRYACTRGDVKMCRLLITHGASVNPPKGTRQWTALHTTAGLDR